MPHRVDVDRGKWSEPTADDVEKLVHVVVQQLARESLAFGRAKKGSTEHASRREAVEDHWHRFTALLAQLRAAERRESKAATRNALHARLCEIVRSADADPEIARKPYVAWKSSIEAALKWLDGWTK